MRTIFVFIIFTLVISIALAKASSNYEKVEDKYSYFEKLLKQNKLSAAKSILENIHNDIELNFKNSYTLRNIDNKTTKILSCIDMSHKELLDNISRYALRELTVELESFYADYSNYPISLKELKKIEDHVYNRVNGEYEPIFKLRNRSEQHEISKLRLLYLPTKNRQQYQIYSYFADTNVIFQHYSTEPDIVKTQSDPALLLKNIAGKEIMLNRLTCYFQK